MPLAIFRPVLIFLLLGLSHLVIAQNQVCGFDPIYQKQFRDPILAQKINAANERIGKMQKSIQGMLQSGKKLNMITGPGGNLYEIPVVVHVIHKGESIGTTNNPSDATIDAMIALLNQVYAGTNTTGGVSTPLRFALAKRDPNCQSTNGIIRVNASNDAEYVANGVGEGVAGKGISDADLKSKSRWPVDTYYNIWIVWQIWDDSPTTTTNGYAYFPGAGNLDGTVLIGNVANGTAQTLSHEMGHAMGLYHTFNGNETSCSAAETDCINQGDRVCDTEPHKKLYNCPPETSSSNKNECTSNNWGLLPKNIMSYFNCRDRFTTGQGSRILSTLLSERYNLATSLGSQPITGSVKAIAHPTTVANDVNSGIGPKKVLIENQNLFYESQGYFSSSKIAYEDKTCTVGATLLSTNNYTIKITTSSGTSGNNRQRIKVWLNLNNNTTFEANELIGSITTPSGTTGDYEHEISLPSSIINASGVHKNVPLRLRVAADFHGSPDYGFDTQLKYGQMEDFTITLTGGLPVTFGSFQAGIFYNELKVNWQSLTEKNNEKYLIQISEDGNNFFTIGEQLSKAKNGSSDEAINYEFSTPLNALEGVFATLFLASAFSLFTFTQRRKYKQLVILTLIFGGTIFSFSCNKKAQDVLKKDKELFLRIAQQDKDGTLQYSKIIRISTE